MYSQERPENLNTPFFGTVRAVHRFDYAVFIWVIVISLEDDFIARYLVSSVIGTPKRDSHLLDESIDVSGLFPFLIGPGGLEFVYASLGNPEPPMVIGMV